MSAAAAELAELRERVDLIDAVLKAMGVPLDQIGPMLAEDHARLEALSAGLSAAFRYAGWRELNGRVDACADIMARAYEAEGLPVPESLRSRSHLRLVREEVPR